MRWSAVALWLVLLASAASAQERSITVLKGQERPVLLFGRACAPVRACDRPCAMWANWQPDFRFSYNACIANCRRVDGCRLEVAN